MQSLLQQQRERESELRQCEKSAQDLRQRLKKMEDEPRQRKESPNEQQLKEMADIRRLLKTYEDDLPQRRQDWRRGEIRRRNVGIRALQPWESEKRVRCCLASRVLEAMNTFLPYKAGAERRHMGKTDAARILLVTVLISRRELDPRAIGLYEDAPWKDGLVGGKELADSGIAERWNGKGEAGANAVWYDVAKDAWKVLAVLGGGASSAAAGEAGQSNVLAGKEGRRKGGRPKLNTAEAHRRLSIVGKWQRAKEAGVAQKDFRSDKSITVADLNRWVNWSTQRQKRRGEST